MEDIPIHRSPFSSDSLQTTNVVFEFLKLMLKMFHQKIPLMTKPASRPLLSEAVLASALSFARAESLKSEPFPSPDVTANSSTGTSCTQHFSSFSI
jgi:hypothetical protein